MNSKHGVARLANATGINKHDNMGDNALSLKSLGDSQSHFCSDVSNCIDDDCRLVLGLGPTSASYCFSNKGYGSGFIQELASRGDSVLQLGLPALSTDSLSGLDCSLSTYKEINNRRQYVVPVVDEGSTSARRSGGYMPSLLLDPRAENVRNPSKMQEVNHFGTSVHYDHSQVSLESAPYNPKKCNFMGCVKEAQGASGICFSHGGGQRCQKPGCNKGAESKTTFCKTHGGGKRCEHLGCTKSAEGKQISAYLMVVEDVVSSLKDVTKQPVANRAFASNTVVAKDVLYKAVHEVLKDKLVFVYPMVVENVVSFLQVVIKELKEVLTTAKPMEVENAVYFQGVAKGQKGVLLCVKHTVVGNAVSLMEAGFALKAYMVGLTSVLLMVVGKDVLWQGVLRVRVVALTVV